jgi:lysophospholipase L1-like esterase
VRFASTNPTARAPALGSRQSGRFSLPQIVKQVTSDAALRGELAKADIVIVSVGANNALPDYGDPPPGGFPAGCDAVAPGIADPIIGHIVATTRRCNEATASAWAKDYDTIFAKIAELRAGKPTVFIALNVYDANIDNPDIKTAMVAATFKATEKVIVDAYDKWHAMLCREAQANQFSRVDLYHLMNGPDGAGEVGDLAIDGTHPSQKGNDMIAALLAKVDLSTVVP